MRIIIIPTLFIQYNERERYQRLSLYVGIRPDVIDLESILRREENQSTMRNTLGVRLRLTETQPTYNLQARVEPGLQRWEARLITTKPSWLPTCWLRPQQSLWLWWYCWWQWSLVSWMLNRKVTIKNVLGTGFKIVHKTPWKIQGLVLEKCNNSIPGINVLR